LRDSFVSSYGTLVGVGVSSGVSCGVKLGVGVGEGVCVAATSASGVSDGAAPCLENAVGSGKMNGTLLGNNKVVMLGASFSI
jgi:hypothetical protein